MPKTTKTATARQPKAASARAPRATRQPKPRKAAPAPQQPKAQPLVGSVVPADFRKKYGKASNNGDRIAAALKNCDLAEVAPANGVDLARWAHLNPGMQRMNLGNTLRGALRRGGTVTIGERQLGAGR